MAGIHQALDFNLPSANATPTIHPIQKPTQITLLLCLLLPSVGVCLVIWPISLLLSLLPVTLVIGLPLCLISTTVLVFFSAWIPYLLYAQDDLPCDSPLLLPISPIKAQRIVRTLIKHIIIIIKLNWIELILDYSYRKIIVMRAYTNALVRRDIVYRFSDDFTINSSTRQPKRLDVYLPPSFNADPNPAPVFVFIHPGGWRWFDKSHFLQLGLRIRRLGFCVVIPDFTQFPEGRCQRSVEDISHALKWVSQSIGQYGGDPSRIFLAGHGSGAHLALLTVLESSIRNSLSDYTRSRTRGLRDVENDTERIELPTIEGMILLSGIYDPINQLRDEVHAGWHQILTTRRAIGPTHAISITNSPTHLLHMAQDFLKTSYLPSKFLIIHGGQDRNVPILQSHLLSKLLENINRQSQEEEETSPRSSKPSSFNSLSNINNDTCTINLNNNGRSRPHEIQIIFKAFKNLDHMNCLFALMLNAKSSTNLHQSRNNQNHHRLEHRSNEYREIIIDQILSFVD